MPYKNMGNTISFFSTNNLIRYSIMVMILCLFISRALLSISMIIFFVLTIANKDIVHQLKNTFNNRFIFSMCLLFLVPFISGLWSTDYQNWLDVVRIKLPLILFPIAFAGKWKLKEKHWKEIGIFFLIVLFAAVCWSTTVYLLHHKEIEQSYLKAKLINTSLENDHVRFSWLVVIGVIISIQIFLEAS